MPRIDRFAVQGHKTSRRVPHFGSFLRATFHIEDRTWPASRRLRMPAPHHHHDHHAIFLMTYAMAAYYL